MFDVGAPATGPELSHAILALQQEGAAFCHLLDPPRFFAPQGTAWSPAEHIRHLRKVTVPISLALRLPGWVLAPCFGIQATPSRSYLQIRDAYRASLARSTSAGLFAPGVEPPPADPYARRMEILAAWQGAVLGFGQAVRRPEPELDRFRLPHPRLGRLSLREMAAFVVYHTAHHLSRIAERTGPIMLKPH